MKVVINIIVLFFMLSSINVAWAVDDRIVAVINNKQVISYYDVIKQIKFINIITTNKINPLDKDAVNVVLNQMINNALVGDSGKTYGITVTYAEALDFLLNLAKNLGVPKDDIIKKAENTGISRDEFMNMVKANVLAEKVKQGFSYSRAQISGVEIDKEVERILGLNGKLEFLMYDISISLSNRTNEEAKQHINFIYKELEKSKNFANIAKAFSEDLSSKNGGEIGWVPQEYVPIEVLQVMEKMKPNAFSKPMKIGNSYKILMYKEIRPLLQLNPSEPKHFAQLRDFVKQKLMFDKSQIVLDEFITDLYQNASITIYK